MSDNNFQIKIQAILDKVKSIANIKADIKIIESKLPKLKFRGTLLKTATQKEVNSKLKSIRTNKINIDADTTQVEKEVKKIGKQKTKTTITPTVDNTQVVSGLKKAQKEVKSVWNKFTDAVFNNLIRMAVQSVTQAVREAIVAVKELDTIKTNIQMVSGTSDSGVNAMMSSYNVMAKTLSSTTKDVAEAANEFLRMGESIENTNELIRSSQILSKVGMIDSADAASHLISSLKGYQVAAEDSIDIVSKLTSVDLEAAVSAGGLSEALSKCANIASNSGVSMDRLIGYTATVGETTQKSMSEVGNSFQSLLSRMNNIKIGRFIDDETGESLSDTEAVLNKSGIQLRDTESTYRSFDDVLDDVGARWESLTKVEQNALSVAIAGTRQRENFEALMNNWANALKYSETAANSAGSALERYGVYQDSIEAKTNELTAAMESLSTNVISEELYSGIIEATTGIVEFLDKTNLLKASLAGLVAMGVSKAIVFMGAGFITAAKSTAQLTAAMTLFNKGKSDENLLAIGEKCKGLSDRQLKLVLSTKELEYENRKLILAGKGVVESEQEQALAALGFGAAEDKATISTFSLKGAINSLRVAFATNPIGFIITGITAAVSIATVAFSWFKKKQEEAAQAMQDAISEYESAKSSLESINSELEEQNRKMDELLAKDNLTYAEKGQLEELQAITKELLLQQDIEEKRAEKASKEVADKTIDAYNKQYGKFDITQEALDEKISYGYDVLPMIDGENDIVGIIFAYIRANELLKQAQIDYEKALANGEDTTTLAADIQNDIDAVDFYARALNTSVSDLQVKRAALEDEYNKVIKKRELELEHLTSSEQNVISTYESIYDTIKFIYKYTDQNTWNTLEFDSIFDTKGLEKTKEELIAMAKAGELSPEVLQAFSKLSAAIKDSELIVEEGSDVFKECYNQLVALADKQADIVKDATAKSSFSETISQVQSLSTGLEKLGKIYTDVKNQEDFDWSSILNNEEFANTFSSMGTVYDNFIRTVSNAPNDIEACQEAFDKLATSYIYNTKDANGNNIMNNLTYSTKDATVAMLEQMGVVNALEIVEAELAKREEVLAVQRLYASEHATELTDATYEQAYAYIKEADCSEIAKRYLAQLYLQKNLFNGTEISTEADCESLIELAKTAGYSQIVFTRLDRLKQMFADNPIMSNTMRADINNAIKNIFNEAQADIQGIDFEINFDGGTATKSASSAAKSFTDLLDKELNVLDKKMEAGYIDFNDYIKARLDLIEDYYRQGKLASDEYYSYLEKHYKQELSYKDKVINAVTRRIDKEIDRLEDRKDEIENYYKVQIDALEKEKTLLQDTNKERQREIDLQKAMYELERARNQRTKLIYSEDKGMHYVTDDTAIRDAQQEVETAEYELKISEIEKQISRLEEARDKETDAIDAMIDKLEEYKDKWNDITSAYEEEQEDLIAAQILGQEWEQDILNTRLDVLNQFKDDYIAIQQAMVDAAYQAAQAMANAENVKLGDSSKGKIGTKEPAHGYEVVDEETASRVGNTFTSKQEADAYADKLNKKKAKANGMTDAQFRNSDIPGYYVKKYHTGLKQGLVDKHSFDDDFKLVQEVGLGEKEVPAILNEGEAVATPAQISNIADGIRSNTVADGVVILKDGTKLYHVKPGDRAWELQQAFKPLVEKCKTDPYCLTHSTMVERSKQMQNMANQLNTTNVVNNKNIQQPIINGGINITCPGITSQEVARQVGVELNNMFNGFHNYVDQQSRIR